MVLGAFAAPTGYFLRRRGRADYSFPLLSDI